MSPGHATPSTLADRQAHTREGNLQSPGNGTDSQKADESSAQLGCDGAECLLGEEYRYSRQYLHKTPGLMSCHSTNQGTNLKDGAWGEGGSGDVSEGKGHPQAERDADDTGVRTPLQDL